MVAAGKQQCHALEIGIDDQRPAITPSAERLVARTFYFDLVVEADIANVVSDDDIIEFKRGHLPVRNVRGAADLVDIAPRVEKCCALSGKGAQALHQVHIERDPAFDRCDGTIDEVGSGSLKLDEIGQLADDIFGFLAAVEGAALQDRIADFGVVLIGQDMVVGKRNSPVCPQ